VPSRHSRLRALEQRALIWITPLRPIVFDWGDESFGETGP
jgi:outer membrane protein assembly factor BamA